MSQSYKLSLLDNNYASKVLSVFLWGDITPPSPSKLHDEKFTHLEGKREVIFSSKEFMDAFGTKFSKSQLV